MSRLKRLMCGDPERTKKTMTLLKDLINISELAGVIAKHGWAAPILGLMR